MSLPAEKRSAPDVMGPVLFLAALLLTALTLLNFFGLERFEAVGTRVSILPPEGLVLENSDPDGIVRHDLPVPLGAAKGFIRIVAEAEGWDIRPGGRPWQRGRIVFLRRDHDGAFLWDVPHVLALLKDDPVRWTFEAVYRGDERAESLSARIELLKATGRLVVYSMTATPLREVPGFRAGAVLLMVAWATLGLAVTWWVWRRVRGRRWLIGIAWLIAAPALMLSVLPSTAASPVRMMAEEAVDLAGSRAATEQEREAAVSANSFLTAKTGHVLMFLVVGFFIGLARGRSGMLSVLIVAPVFASLCELLQIFSPNREPSGFDVMLNAGSSTAGVIAALIVLSLPAFGPALRKL